MTGVSATTLRSWERRYGVPAPQRGASAYRLFSDADVELVRVMRALVESGVPASEAARRVMSPVTAPLAAVEVVDPYAAAADRIIAAVDAFDVAAIEEAVRLALTLGSASGVYERVLRPALVRMGELWEAGIVGIGQEHVATQIIETALRDTVRLVQPVDGLRTVLLACVAEEQHTLGLHGVGLRFAGWSYRVAMIGACTPPEALAEAVTRLRPDVVGLSVTMPVDPRAARRLIAAYGDACQGTTWVMGGAQAARLADTIIAAGGLPFGGVDLGALHAPLERAVRERRDQEER